MAKGDKDIYVVIRQGSVGCVGHRVDVEYYTEDCIFLCKPASGFQYIRRIGDWGYQTIEIVDIISIPKGKKIKKEFSTTNKYNEYIQKYKGVTQIAGEEWD